MRLLILFSVFIFSFSAFSNEELSQIGDQIIAICPKALRENLSDGTVAEMDKLVQQALTYEAGYKELALTYEAIKNAEARDLIYQQGLRNLDDLFVSALNLSVRAAAQDNMAKFLIPKLEENYLTTLKVLSNAAYESRELAKEMEEFKKHHQDYMNAKATLEYLIKVKDIIVENPALRAKLDTTAVKDATQLKIEVEKIKDDIEEKYRMASAKKAVATREAAIDTVNTYVPTLFMGASNQEAAVLILIAQLVHGDFPVEAVIAQTKNKKKVTPAVENFLKQSIEANPKLMALWAKTLKETIETSNDREAHREYRVRMLEALCEIKADTLRAAPEESFDKTIDDLITTVTTDKNSEINKKGAEALVRLSQKFKNAGKHRLAAAIPSRLRRSGNDFVNMTTSAYKVPENLE